MHIKVRKKLLMSRVFVTSFLKTAYIMFLLVSNRLKFYMEIKLCKVINVFVGKIEQQGSSP